MPFSTQIDAMMADKQLIWAPVRHHSPQCSWQLQCLIEQEKPDVILIEGPSEANHLLSYLSDKEARPPLAIYSYAVADKNHWQNSAAEDAIRYRCFMPMAAMSPEWVAIQSAAKQQIPCQFMDLPYVQRLEISQYRDDFSQEQDRSLYTDRLLAKADFISTLLQQSSCRDFDEWWDRHFESGVKRPLTTDSARQFFRDLLHFCVLLRHQQEHDIDQETRAREVFMAQQIRPYLQQGKRCLIVCGGYHCQGIDALLQEPELDLNVQINPPDKSISSSVHLVPYSLQRLNNSQDYAAGMPDCGYYHQLWAELEKKNKAKKILKNKLTPAELYPDIIAQLCIQLAEQLRQENFMVTLPDVIEAVLMGHRLANLRGCLIGRSEFRDALLSCFLKQAQDDSGHYMIRLIDQFLAGNISGRLPGCLPVVPLVEDFRQQCNKYKLPLTVQSLLNNNEKKLNIYRSERHRKISRLLHQLSFLQINYARRIAGPKFAEGKDLNRVQEVWQISWSVNTEAQLIEQSHYGNNLLDATLNRLLQQLYDPGIAGADKVPLLVSALSMGLHKVLAPIVQQIKHWLHSETQVSHLCHGLHHLTICFYTRSALAAQGLGELQGLLEDCFKRLCIRLPWLGSPSDSDSEQICEALSDINGLVLSQTPWCDADMFYEALRTLLQQGTNALLSGVCSGALYAAGRIEQQHTQQLLLTAFSYAALRPEHAGTFLRGFLLLARGALLVDRSLILLINQQLMSWDEQEFLHSLPFMRLAFSQLSPREIRSLAQHLNTDMNTAEALHYTASNWSAHSLQQAHDLSQQLAQVCRQWGME